MGILKTILMPSQFAIVLVLSGILIHLLGIYRCLKFFMLAAGFGVYVLFSFGPVATMMMSPLEYKYPPLRNVEDYPGVNQVVILAAYTSSDSTIPQSSWPSGSAMFRVVEAFHIYSARPDVTIFVSGNRGDVEILASQLEKFGVPSHQIVKDSGSAHTIDSAEGLDNIMPDKSFFLVTSAGHMPRSVVAFELQGLDPVPAPTDYQLPDSPGKASRTLSSKHLYFSDLAMREYGGTAWYYLTN